jgi:hypothetical protein
MCHLLLLLSPPLRLIPLQNSLLGVVTAFLTLDYYSLVAFTTTALSETASYRDAILHPEWQHAIAEEIAALERTDTLNLVPCPPRVRPITCKWVYKVNTLSDGSLECYKARLVAHGFQQEHDRNYDETFAPVAHMTVICTLLVVASV